MKKTSNKNFKELPYVIGFILLFVVIFTVFTLIYYPKFGPKDQQAQFHGIYKEDKDSIDVVYLGSCNMYTSISPTIIWEKTGITGYAMTCPDQNVATSYYYLKDCLKRQSPKVVFLESLFLQHHDVGDTRPKYNHYALDYMPMSLNKIKLADKLVDLEMESMKDDSSYPSRFVTYMSYMFPMIKYHNRTDASVKDAYDFYFNTDQTFFNKGGWGQYNYIREEKFEWDQIFNDLEISKTAEEYFPMLVDLCKENNIQLVVIKSPNYMRWGHDDTYTSISRNYVESFGLPFVDMMSDEYNDFEAYDYGLASGRLGVYGMKKFSNTVAKYLTHDLGLKATKLTDEQTDEWKYCVESFYTYADEMGCPLEAPEIAQITCGPDMLTVRWNLADDCGSYSLYRCKGKDGKFKLLKSGLKGNIYNDKDVDELQGYSYYVVPEKGSLKGKRSETKYYIYLPMIEDASAESYDGKIKIRWKTPENVSAAVMYRRSAEGLDYDHWDTITGTGEQEYVNVDMVKGRPYHYRLCSSIKEDDVTYYSSPVFVEAIGQDTPELTSCTKEGKSVELKWNSFSEASEVLVYRKASDEKKFSRIAKIDGKLTSYTDSSIKKGKNYSYKILTVVHNYRSTGRSEYSNIMSVK